MAAEPFFLAATTPEGGQRFCLWHPAQGLAAGQAPRGLILYIHPFAEEMNKARRMAALQSRAFAKAGFEVLQIDLLGCGDSSGDFGDASWDAWVNDAVQGSQWLLARHPRTGSANPPALWLWGLRAGCLIASAAAAQLGQACNFLFWQAPGAGKTLLQQFLRLKVAGDMLGGQGKGAMEGMRNDLAEGRPVDVAGYRLSPALANGLERAVLKPAQADPPEATRVEWFELTTRSAANTDGADSTTPPAPLSISPASAQTVAKWQAAGYAVRSQVVQGPSFWQTQEIEDAPNLIAACVDSIRAGG